MNLTRDDLREIQKVAGVCPHRGHQHLLRAHGVGMDRALRWLIGQLVTELLALARDVLKAPLRARERAARLTGG